MQLQFEKRKLVIQGYFSRAIFPRPPKVLGVGNDTYGITIFEIASFSPENECDSLFEGEEITIVGDFGFTPASGKTYSIYAEEVNHPQYGLQYRLIYIEEVIDFSNLKNQKDFLRTFLTELQIKEMYNVLENPVEIIAAHDIETLITVKGIGPVVAEKIIERFETVKNSATAIVELTEYGLTPNFIRKIIKHFGSPQKAINIVKNNPYKLVEVDYVGFMMADEIAMKGKIGLKSPERIEAYITYYLRSQGEEGNSYITAGELLSNLYEFFGGKDAISEEIEIDGESVNNIAYAIKKLQDKKIITVEENENKSRRRVYLNNIKQLEENIAQELKRLCNAKNDFSYINWEEKIKNQEKKQGYEFDETQKAGIKLALDESVCLITGSAGTGKSSLVSGVLSVLNNYDFAQCALSGKASARLQEATGEESYTIHRLLKWNPGDSGFVYNKDNPLPYDIIIVDEISMVGGNLFLSLLKAIKTGSKLIMLGDMGQLEAIGLLNLAADMYNSPIIPTVKLSAVHRQAAKSGILTSSMAIRQQNLRFNREEEGVIVEGELKDMYFDLSYFKDTALEKIEFWFKKLYNTKLVDKDINNIQIISPVNTRGNTSVYVINNAIQQIVNPITPQSLTWEIKAAKDKSYFFHVNDKIICTKNNYHLPDEQGEETSVFNGWTGIIRSMTNSSMKVYFPVINKIVILSREDVSSWALGYAISVHKSQGQNIPAVIMVLNFSTPPKMLTNNLLYTGITRASKLCVLVGETGAVNKAINTEFVSTKRTFLQELLIENNRKEE